MGRSRQTASLAKVMAIDIFEPITRVRSMSVDAMHAALGIAFTGIWLLVGQILAGDH